MARAHKLYLQGIHGVKDISDSKYHTLISWDEAQYDFTLPKWMWMIAPLLLLKSLTNGGIAHKFYSHIYHIILNQT